MNDECGVRKQPFAVVRCPLDKRKLSLILSFTISNKVHPGLGANKELALCDCGGHKEDFIDKDGKINVVVSVGDPDELLKQIRPRRWNDYPFCARGDRIVLKINDVVM